MYMYIVYILLYIHVLQIFYMISTICVQDYNSSELVANIIRESVDSLCRDETNMPTA